MGAVMETPPALPRGWEAVARTDPATGQPVILMRVKPYRRRLFAGAGAVGAVALWAYLAVMSVHGGGWPLAVGLAFVASSATVGVIVLGSVQDGWAVARGRMWTGRVWVSGGTWRGRRKEVTALELRDDLTDGIATVSLDAILRPGFRREIFVDGSDARVARPLAAWLSGVADIPIRPPT